MEDLETPTADALWKTRSETSAASDQNSDVPTAPQYMKKVVSMNLVLDSVVLQAWRL